MKFLSKVVEIEATQWFHNSDHPQDDCKIVTSGKEIFLSEGKIVRYFRCPDVSGDSLCKHCNRIMHIHGWIDTLEGGHIVCPGDWIITGLKGEHYPCKPDIFKMKYEAKP
jgi:hypothetical protein